MQSFASASVYDYIDMTVRTLSLLLGHGRPEMNATHAAQRHGTADRGGRRERESGRQVAHDAAHAQHDDAAHSHHDPPRANHDASLRHHEATRGRHDRHEPTPAPSRQDGGQARPDASSRQPGEVAARRPEASRRPEATASHSRSSASPVPARKESAVRSRPEAAPRSRHDSASAGKEDGPGPNPRLRDGDTRRPSSHNRQESGPRRFNPTAFSPE